MVMVEGVATQLDPDLNMWEASGPFVNEWIRSEMGPEAWLADRIVDDVKTLAGLPELIRRIEAQFPRPGGAPPPPPIREVQLIGSGSGWRYALVTILAGAAGAAAMLLLG
jgi:ubiquinone biosynthesis protein